MTIRPYDAWVLSRLLCGFALNGELEAVSTPFRPLAHHLAVRSAEARQDDWEAFLTGRDDRDQIILALADVDPLGPPPEADADDDEAAPPADWPEEPRPVRHELSARPDPAARDDPRSAARVAGRHRRASVLPARLPRRRRPGGAGDRDRAEGGHQAQEA